MKPMNQDQNLEAALKQALQRNDPPVNFTANVLTRAAQKQSAAATAKRQWFHLFSQPLVRWAAFAAVSTCLIVGGVYYRDVRRERAQGEAAKQQLMLALRIAGSKLQLAKEKVNEINPKSPKQLRPARSRS